MDMTRAQNLLEHQNEIYSRPARTWFQTEMEKKKSKGNWTSFAIIYFVG
jgi:ATP-dependent RNA helicase DDX27